MSFILSVMIQINFYYSINSFSTFQWIYLSVCVSQFPFTTNEVNRTIISCWTFTQNTPFVDLTVPPSHLWIAGWFNILTSTLRKDINIYLWNIQKYYQWFTSHWQNITQKTLFIRVHSSIIFKVLDLSKWWTNAIYR